MGEEEEMPKTTILAQSSHPILAVHVHSNRPLLTKILQWVEHDCAAISVLMGSMWYVSYLDFL